MDQPSYYTVGFLGVSGIVDQLPQEFPSPEGQMFNADWELRWKQQGKGYEVLLLKQILSLDLSVGQNWETQLQPLVPLY